MQTLRYRPAPGQDTAPLLAALSSAGYEADPESRAGQQLVVITSRDGTELDADQVRSVLEEANKTSVFDGGDVAGPIRFEHEQ